MGILLDMGWEMQEEWDLSVKVARLDYNKTMLTSSGQTPIFTMFRWTATLLVCWIHPEPKADREMELSDWTEVMQVTNGLCWYER